MSSIADGSGYFLYHSIGMFPGKEALVAEGLRKYAHLWSVPDDSQWPQALAIRGQFIECWRKLINAQPATLTTAENVTTALYSRDRHRHRCRRVVIPHRHGDKPIPA
jgi:hypothetical protein